MVEQNAQTGDMKAEVDRLTGKSINYKSCYAHSFGLLPHETTYVNGWQNGYDLRESLGQKAIEGFNRIQQKTPLGTTAGGAGTAGYALVPVYVDPRIVDLSRKYTPLVEMFPRVTNQGMTADYNVITSKGDAYTAPEDAPLPEQKDESERKSEWIKFLYSVGRVTGPMQSAMPSYMVEGFQPTGEGLGGAQAFEDRQAPNAIQMDIMLKARSLKEKEEDLLINGDKSSDETEFDGIIKKQGNTNKHDLEGGALTWVDIDKCVQKAFDNGGRPKLAVAPSGVLTELRKLMIDSFRWGPEHRTQAGELPFGVPPQLVIPTIVGDIPVIPSMFMTNDTGNKQMYFLDTDYIEVRVLQDMTYENLAKGNDSNKFMLKIYECLIMRAPQFNAFIDNIY